MAHVGTLYVNRPLENADQVIEWAKHQGFSSTLQPDDMHVTIAFSKRPVHWDRLESQSDSLHVQNGQRSVSPLGDKGAVVLHFENPQLHTRWQAFRKAGASWDHPGYHPHVTLSYDSAGMDLDQIEPYSGPLIFGAEEFHPLDENWDQKIEEVPLVVETKGFYPTISYAQLNTVSPLMEINRMTELSTLLMRNIDLILEAYTVDENGSLKVGNKKKVQEADEVFHEYFVKSMNTMFRQINENDPIMHQPDGMGMQQHGHSDLGIGHDMMGDMQPMGAEHQMGGDPMGGQHMMGDEDDMTGMYPHQMAHHGMEMADNGMGQQRPGYQDMGGPQQHMGGPQQHMEGAQYDWLFSENVEDVDINRMFDIDESEEQINEFGDMHDQDQFGMGDNMDQEGGHNDMGGDMGGMANSGGDNMGLDSSLDGGGDSGGMSGMGMGGDMGGGDGEMTTIHGTTDNGSDFEFSFDPNTLGFDDMDGSGEGHEEHGHEHHGHEEHHGGGDIGHPDAPGMGEDDQPPMAEASEHFHNGKPRKTGGPKSSRMAVVPANPKVGHAAPFPTPMGNKQKR